MNIQTNVYSIQNKIGKVTLDINPIEGKGQIKVNGEVWSAKSSNDIPIPKDTEVLVEKIDGVKEQNLVIYANSLFESYYDAVEKFTRDCRLDKQEDILWG